MFKLLKNIIKTGDVTTKYPFAPLEVCQGFRGKPEHNPEQCIVCAACTMACPANALSMHNNTKKNVRIWQLNVGRCIFCGRCEEVCPTHAVVLSENFELAVSKKEDFYQQSIFTLLPCTECGTPFAAKKEVEYALEILTHSGLTQEAADALRPQLATCPECKRKLSLSHNSNILLGRHLAEDL